MPTKFLAAALLAATAVSGCVTRPVVVASPPPAAIDKPMPMPAPAQMPMPMPMPMPGSMSLHDQVHAALQDGLGSAASGISVGVDGSKVSLTGHVATQADHERARTIAHDVPGVTLVEHSGLQVP